MAKLNTAKATAAPARSRGPLRTQSVPTTVTHEGAPAFGMEPKTELFLTGSTGYINEKTFYEAGDARVVRYADLVRTVAVSDPEWFIGFNTWLRDGGNIRTGSVVAAVHGAKAFIDAGKPELVEPLGMALLRADEPGEFFAYWRQTISRNTPRPVKRMLGAAMARLYNEYSVGKYDTAKAAYRFGDIVELVFPNPTLNLVGNQSALYKYLLDRRRHSDEEPPESLPMLRAAWNINRLSVEEKRALLLTEEGRATLKAAGMTWENVSGFGEMDAQAWEAAVPMMGYMARLRNLRNLEQAGVDDKLLRQIAAHLADPQAVVHSRQMPYRFFSAYREVQSSLWLSALDQALQASLANIPELPGKTVVLVDTSGSMSGLGYSEHSKIRPVEAGALFGIALAAKNSGAVLMGFADQTPFTHQVVKGASVLREVERFLNRVGEAGGGTEIGAALAFASQKHPDAARFVIVTDMQTFGPNRGGWYGYGSRDVSTAAPADKPVYAFDVVGYGKTPMATSSTRHQLGGLTDRTFEWIGLIEAGQQGKWPWLR